MRVPMSCLALLAGLCQSVMPPQAVAAEHGPGSAVVCVPVSQKAERSTGCFIVAERRLGPLGKAPLFWHVTRFALKPEADDAAMRAGPTSTAVEAYGKGWLLTIADARWRPGAGDEVAVIGPLPIDADTSYAAMYMEASMPPGTKSRVHVHSGPEAFYTLSGESCLETPSGSQRGGPGGDGVVVPGGVPMQLTATGRQVRRSLVLVLHDAARPATTAERNWVPKGLCR